MRDITPLGEYGNYFHVVIIPVINMRPCIVCLGPGFASHTIYAQINKNDELKSREPDLQEYQEYQEYVTDRQTESRASERTSCV
jgi:hypothetical protein